jgi:hypothetical protein
MVGVLDCLSERLQDADGGLMEAATRTVMLLSIFCGEKYGDSLRISAWEREGEGDQREDLGLPVLDNFIVGGRN